MSKCCLVFLTIITVITIGMFVAIYKTRMLPSIRLEEFYVPGLNTTTSNNLTTPNNTIYINLRLKNRNPKTGIHYDPLYLNISFIPKPSDKSIPLGEYRMNGFYQGNGKAKQVMGVLMTRGLQQTISNLTSNGIFKVDVYGAVRYKLVGYRKRHGLKLAANVEVDYKSGKKVVNETITLSKS